MGKRKGKKIELFFPLLILSVITEGSFSYSQENKNSNSMSKGLIKEIKNLADEGKSEEAIDKYLILFNRTGEYFLELLYRIGIGALKNESGFVRNYALLAIEELKLAEKEAIPYIKNTFLEKGRAKILSCEILGNIKDKESISLLFDALKDKDIRVRISAAKSLLKLGEDKGIQILYEEFKKGKGEIKMEIAETLAEIGDRSIISFLQKSLKERKTKYRAALCLFKLSKDKTYISILKEGLEEKDEELSIEAAMALAEIGEESVLPFLKIKLKSEKEFGYLSFKKIPVIKIMAIKALAKIGDKTVVPDIIKILKNKKKELIIYSPVKVEAALALGVLGDISAIQPLYEELKDKTNSEIEKVVICMAILRILKG